MKRILATLALVVASGFIFAGGAKSTLVKSGSSDSDKTVIHFTTTDLDGNKVTEKIFADNKITRLTSGEHSADHASTRCRTWES